MAKVLKNIAFAVELRAAFTLELDLGAQFVLLRENKHSLLQGIKNLKECGIDFVSIKPFVYQNENNAYENKNSPLDSSDVSELIKEANKFSDENFKVIFRENAFDNSFKPKGYKHCYGANFISVLNSAGQMATCLPYWDREEFIYGNIYEQSFYEIWNGEKRAEIKKHLESSLDCASCPKNCRPNAINEFLSELQNPTIKHINFI